LERKRSAGSGTHLLFKVIFDTLQAGSTVRNYQVSGLCNHDATLSEGELFFAEMTESRFVSKLLGHSSMKMTQRYAHESIDTMKTAMQKLTLATVPDVSLKGKGADK